ncbi:MAG: enoyl-CoA hydratase/isomerase family protein [Deltaproteobacteria bacterium]|nr:enoyl-CoA hydratase/isomerase family protein [Deltaproteobacteria bacterium]
MVQLVTYNIDENGVGHVVFDNPDERVNSISELFIEQFMSILDQVEKDANVKALVLESAKPGVFVAGADIKWLQDLKTPEDCLQFARAAQPPFSRLEDLRIPTLAVINGICLGGGLELALSCKWRVAMDHPSVQLGLPEVNLGVIPGGGGTQRLPALIGVGNALPLITTGKSLRVKDSLAMGLIDAVLPAENFVEGATQFLLDKVKANEDISRPWLAEDFRYDIGTEESIEKLFDATRQAVLKQTKGHSPAHLKVIDVIRVGAEEGFKTGMKAENDAFAEVLASTEAKSLIYLFLTQAVMKKVYGSEDRSIKPVEIKKVGVLGAGQMGHGIAHSAITAGYRVVLNDVKQEYVDKGVNAIRAILSKDVEKKKMTSEKMEGLMSLLKPTIDYNAFRDVDIVIEAVFEDVDIKHKVIREVEKYISEDCIFASNTSSLAISELAKASNRPKKFIGMHYFSPVNRMPLLEIIKGQETSDETVVTAVALAHKTGKTPIVVNDGYGFYTTRSVASYLAEALNCLNDGATIEDIDRSMAEFGMPVGPITLLDEVGHDVGAHVLAIMQKVYPERFSDELAQLTIKDNRLGRKNQRGYYAYESISKKTGIDESVYALFTDRKNLTLSREEIQKRIIMALINEVGFCLSENIITSYNDAEIGLIYGIGFPPFRGGPLHYIDNLGADEIVTLLRTLESRWGSRFKPSPSLVKAAQEGKVFFP